jgi:hypothetical protein
MHQPAWLAMPAAEIRHVVGGVTTDCGNDAMT